MLEVADGGTLFLDEIGNISMATQAKLLRVIQEREFRAVGRHEDADGEFPPGHRDQQGPEGDDCATAPSARTCSIGSTFFRSACRRCASGATTFPSLAFHMLGVIGKDLGKKVREISEGAMSVLMHHDWPGNVRELENVVQRAAILATDGVIRRAHLVGHRRCREEPASTFRAPAKS